MKRDLERDSVEAGAPGTLSRNTLTMPVLTIGGDKSLGGFLGRQMKEVATDVTGPVIEDAGHRVMEERPSETAEALLRFL